MAKVVEAALAGALEAGENTGVVEAVGEGMVAEDTMEVLGENATGSSVRVSTTAAGSPGEFYGRASTECHVTHTTLGVKYQWGLGKEAFDQSLNLGCEL